MGRHNQAKPISEKSNILDEDMDFVSSASIAVLQQSPKGAQVMLFAIAIFVVLFLLWAGFSEVDEFSRGEGRVIPSQQVQVIQNLEGGILAEFYVHEGEKVKRGDTLVRIDDTQFLSSLSEATVTLEQLEVKSTRLRAEADGRDFIVASSSPWSADAIQQEQQLFQSRQQEFNSSREVLEEQIEQKQQELSELNAKREQLAGSLSLLLQELSKTREAAAGGAISEVELLRMERQVNDMKGELRAAELAIPRAQSLLDEVKEKFENADLVFRREAREELNEVTIELSRLVQTSKALADRVSRTVVKSPVSGTVKRFLVNTVGGILQPGMDIAEIVPSEEVLLVEARIRPSDIAYLHPGQLANIRFSAYDFAVMGGLEGKVVHLSPDTIEDEQGEHYYLVRVETNSAFIAPNGVELPIIAGMTVTVDILTGKKSILSYILKPILKTKQLALKER